ncbi:Hsp70 family protein [Actinomadura sp. NEAU-AAG7]|uniref:Hsp70 family protein n=1 Tax=Actinomadura sp. NEAU-AAG7 TaxID=2839640 RepID=UPI001BE42309|nr:Hsp70 family protein [Actinomadura sp. NEAU-AAG7]MBT2207930.1 Hsp70 family protein [Actinomadura sp. NEAU-AAG7]
MTQVVSKAVGIDLGTTNSAVAIMDPTDTDIVIHRDPVTKFRTTPSCVWRSGPDAELVVGRRARNQVGRRPEPITSIKRSMGQPGSVRLAGAPITPEAVSAAILAEMKRQIEEDVARFETSDTTWQVDRAIVTVPAYFDQPQIDATRRAAEMAGLECLELLHEPTAAASHHCWRTGRRDGTFMVYDLGGGTFDVSVVRCTAGVYEVLGISGNNRLGGDDIDADFTRHLLEMLCAEGAALDLDPHGDADDRLLFDDIKRLAEGVKVGLSSEPDYAWRENGRILDKAGDPVLIEAVIERSELDAVVRPHVERTLAYCHEALERAQEKAGISLSDVDEIILAGGSTHIPLVREMVATELCAGAKCDEPVYEQVDTVVAMGAAIRAAVTGGLSVYDSERTVRVSFRGTSASARETTHVGGTVESLTGEHDLTGGYVKLQTPDGVEDDSDIGPRGSFAFKGVALRQGVETMLGFEVFDRDDRLVAAVGRPITQSEEARRLPGVSNTAVCPKAILLEVNQAGQKRRKTLIPELQELPTSAEFDFSHPGDTETLLLPIYQRSKNIQVIRVPVDSSTPRGTRIHLEVQMDRHSYLTAQGTIGDQPFEFDVQAPAERAMPSPDEVTGLEQGFQDAASFLPAGRRATVSIQFDMALKAYRRSQETGDEKGAVHEFEQMEEILAGIQVASAPLQPLKGDFDKIVSDCDEINSYLAGADKVHDAQEMSRSIEAQRVRGEKAYRESDQAAYSEVFRQLEAYRSYLLDRYRQNKPAGTEMSPEERASLIVQIAEEEAETVHRNTVLAGRDDLRATVEGIRRDLKELGGRAARDPQSVIQRAVRTRDELERINNLLQSAPGEADGKLFEDF